MQSGEALHRQGIHRALLKDHSSNALSEVRGPPRPQPQRRRSLGWGKRLAVRDVMCEDREDGG